MDPNSVAAYVQNVRNAHSAYHHHKEQMAFGATGLYLTGATALLFLEHPFWNARGLPLFLAVFAALFLAVASLVFISWQYSKREHAATMVRACDHLLARWVLDPTVPTIADRRLEDDGTDRWPKFLVDEIRRHRTEDKWKAGLRQSARLTYVLIATWFLLLLMRICGVI